MSVNSRPTFAVGDGKVTTEFQDQGTATSLAFAPDGSIVVAGAGGSNATVVRYRHDGALDTTFGGDGRVVAFQDHFAYAVVVQADGRTILSGTTGNQFALQRFEADGDPDTTFDGDGRLTMPTGDASVARSVVLQPDGKIVAAGYGQFDAFTQVDFVVARYTAAGSLDTGFGSGGIVTTRFDGLAVAHAVALDPTTGRIVVAGGANNSRFLSEFAVARYNANGSLDTTFHADGKVITPVGLASRASAVVVQADGRIVVGGISLDRAINEDFTLVRYNTDGSLDTTFGGDGVVTTRFNASEYHSLTALALMADGRIVAAGHTDITPDEPNDISYDFAVARYNADGSLDTTFSGDGMVTTDIAGPSDQATAVGVQPDGRILVAGISRPSGGEQGFAVVRYNADGELDRSFGATTRLDGAPTFLQATGAPVVLDPDVRIYDADLAAQDNYAGAVLTLRRNDGANAHDVYVGANLLGPLTEGSALTYSGETVGTVTTNSGGTLVLTFGANATQARLDGVLQSIAYRNTSTAPPGSVQIDWTFSDGNTGAQGTGGPLAAAGSTTVTIVPAVPPANTVPGAQSVAEDTNLAIAGVSVSAPSLPSVQVTLTAVNGLLTLPGTGLSFTGGDGTADAQMTFSGLTSAVNAALANLVYRGSLDYYGPDTITLATSYLGATASGAPLTDTDTMAVTVTGVNDAPVNTVPGAQNVNEDTDLTLSGISVFDAEAANVEVALSAAHGALTLFGIAGLTFTAGDGAADAGMTFRGSQSDVRAALAGLVYRAATDYTGADTITLSTSDLGAAPPGAALTDTDTIGVTVNALNDAPVNTVPGAQNANEDTDLTVNGISVFDREASEVQLSLTAAHGALTLSAIAGLTFTAGDGTADASMTFSGSQSAVNAALANLVYRGGLDYYGPDTITLTTSDLGTAFGAALTDNDTIAVTVIGVNDAPVNTVPGPQNVNEDTDLTVGGIGVFDAEAPDVEVALAAAHGALTLSGIAGLTFTTGDGAADASMTFHGAQNDVRAALAGLVYRAATDYAGADTITLTTSDLGAAPPGAALTDTDTIAVEVSAVNDAPVNTVPGAQNVNEDTDLSVNGVGVFDREASEVRVSLTAAHGALTLSGIAGLTFTAGDGAADASMTFSGSQASVNAALTSLLYRGVLDYAGPDTVTIATSDLGASGSGGTLTDTDIVAISIAPVDDAPVNAVPGAQTVAEGSALTVSGVGVDDPDSGVVQITLSAVHGRLTLSDTSELTFAAGGDGTAERSMTFSGTQPHVNAALANLTYRAAALFHGPDTITIQTSASGATGGGTLSDLDTIAVFVQGANIAPRFATGGVLTSFGSNEEAFSVAIAADGKIVAAGYMQESPGSSFAIGRYNTDGSLDTAFSGDGRATVAHSFSGSYGRGVALQSDGKIVVAGNTPQEFIFPGRLTLTRLNVNGTLDGTFDGDGVAFTANAEAYALALDAAGRAIVGGRTDGGDFYLERRTVGGALDASFGSGGKVSTPIGSSTDYIRGIALQADGKIVAAGATYNGGILDVALARYNANGSLDTSFGAAGKVVTDFGSHDIAQSVALQVDGKIVIAARETNFDGFFPGVEASIVLARYDTNGTLDPTFDGDGKVATGIVSGADNHASSVVIQPDGRILVAGWSNLGGAGYVFALQRYQSNGSPDPTFGDMGMVTTALGAGNARGFDVALHPDGSIVVVGSASNGANTDFAIARYHANGRLDATFAPTTLDGTPTYVEGGAPVVLDGNVVVHDAELASFGSYAGATFTLQRATPDAADLFVAAGLLQPLTEGDPLVYNGQGVGTVTHNSGGALTLTFGAGATPSLVNSVLRSIAYATSANFAVPGSIQLVAAFSDGNAGDQGTGGALSATGSITVTQVPLNDAPMNTAPAAVSGDEDAAIQVAGVSAFDSAAGAVQVTLSALHGTLSLGATSGLAFGSSGANLIFSGSQAAVNAALAGLVYRPATHYSGSDTITVHTSDLGGAGVGGVLTDTDTVAVTVDGINDAPTFVVGTGMVTAPTGQFASARALAVQSDGRIVVAGSAENKFALARYDTDGTLDTTFDGDGKLLTAMDASFATANAVVLQPDGRIVVAGGAGLKFALARYLADGTPDTTFDGDGKRATDFSSAEARAVALQADGKIVATGHASGGASTDFALARYNADGSLDTTFDGDGRLTTNWGTGVDFGNAVAVQGDGKIVVAGSAAVGRTISNGSFSIQLDVMALARYNPNGSLDSTFGDAGKVATAISTEQNAANSVAVQSDGKIVVVGYLHPSAGSSPQVVIARYNADGTLDTSFGGTGSGVVSTGGAATDIAYSVLVAPDGKIVVAGVLGGSHIGVLRYNADGTPDPTFDGDGSVTTAVGSDIAAYGVAMQSNGRILVVGDRPFSHDMSLVRYDTDGSIDTTFNPHDSLDGAPTFSVAPVVLDGDVRVHDAELAQGNHAGATLTLSRHGGPDAQDRYSAGALSPLAQGSSIVIGGVTVAAVTTNAGGTLVLTFEAAATQAHVNSVLQAIAYSNAAGHPPASVQIDWTFSDGNTTGAQGSGGARAATGSTTVAIVDVDLSPVANPDSVDATEDTPATYTAAQLLANDSDLDTAPAGLSIASVTALSHGSVVLNEDGSVTFTPEANFNGDASFSYTVQDATSTSAPVTVSARIASVADAPVGTNSTLTVLEDSFHAFAAADFGFSDPHDAPANQLVAVRITTLPAAGALTLDGAAVAQDQLVSSADIAAGLLVFTPAPDANGGAYASFTFQVQDDGDSANGGVDRDGVPRTMTVNVTAENDAPVARADTLASTDEDRPITYTAAALLGNDSDIDTPHANLFVASVGNAANGTVLLNPDGTVTFTPAASFSGGASFEYAVSDGSAASAAATATLTVAAVDDLPVADSDVLGATEDTSGTYAATDLLGNDSDMDSPDLPLAIASVTSGTGGSAVRNADGTVTFTPDANFHGAASFSYTITNGVQTSAPANVTVNVAAVNDAPVLGALAAAASYTENAPALALAGGVTLSDIDSPTLAFAAVRIAAGLHSGDLLDADVIGTSITKHFNAAAGVLQLSGSDSRANYEQVLRSVTYRSASEDPTNGGGSASRSIEWQVSDGTAASGALFNVAGAFDGGPVALAVALGDLDGDGDLDAVLPNESTDTLSVLFGNGAGGLSGPVAFATGGMPAHAVLSDLDGDGDLDIAIATQLGGVSLLRGDGHGGFAAAVGFAAGGSPRALAAGDLNADGRPDLVVANASSDDVSVLLADGSGGFAAPQSYAAHTTPFSVAIGDFNGDGAADIVTANTNSNDVSVLLGNGNGTFGAAANFATGPNPYSVASGDLDGDGDLDLATANYTANTVGLLLGDGNGGFTNGGALATDSVPLSVAAADFDGDGDLDLAAANAGSSSVSLFVNDGSGTFAGAGTVAAGGNPGYIAAGNLDGAGGLDLVVASYSSNATVLLNASAALSAVRTTTVSVNAVNDAPVLDASRTPVLDAQNEDAGAPSGAVGTLVSSLVDFSGGGGLDNVADPDSVAPGIALTGTAGNGTWHYSLDSGATWSALGTVSDSAALLLSADSRLYFQPDANVNGTIADAITLRAWDASAGANGDIADASVNGSATAFSTGFEEVALTVISINDVPLVDLDTSDGSASLDFIVSFTEGNAPVAIAGTAAVSDADHSGPVSATITLTNPEAGDALTIDAGALAPLGVALDPGSTASTIVLTGAASPASYAAAVGLVRFGNGSTHPSTATRVVTTVMSDGVDNSVAANTIVQVNAINVAPVATSVALETVLEDVSPSPAGIAALFAGHFSDPDDPNLSIIGIAIVANAAGAQGAWLYSSDGGSTWWEVGLVSETAALALQHDAMLRFVPVPDGNGVPSLSAYALDDSYAGGFSFFGPAGYIDTTVNGGSSAVSDEPVTISAPITPVNDAPTFLVGRNEVVQQSLATRNALAWATGISPGAFNETGQTLTFTLTPDNAAIFGAGPAINAAGALTYTPTAPGTANVSVELRDDGGTADGGADTAPDQAFTITVVAGDTIRGGTADENVVSGAGVQQLFGGEGSDVLSGGAGADRLDGEDGLDFAVYETAVTASLAKPAHNTGDAAGDVYFGIEGLVGSAFADTLIGNDQPNVLAGMGGNDYLQARSAEDTLHGGGGIDQLEGGGGGDALDGGGGFDYAKYAYAAARVTLDLMLPDANEGDAAGDTYTSIEGAIGSRFGDALHGDGNSNDLVGLAGNDELHGRDGRDNLQGGDGSDTLHGGADGDRISGGNGFDFAAYEASVVASLASPWQNTGEALGDGYLSVEGLVGSGGKDTLIGDNSANELRGMGGDDTVQGRAGADVLLGGEGNDQLEGGAHGDVLDGGEGFDWARYNYSTLSVQVDLANPLGNTGDAAGDTYSLIEGIVGSLHNDFLIGDDTQNDLAGLAGDDALSGRGSDDNLQGMGGNDVLHGGAGVDQLAGGAGNDDFTFAFGEADGEMVVDFEGNAAAVGDRLIFVGYGAASTFTQIDAMHWAITSSTFATTETLTFLNGASIDVANDVLIS